MLALQEYDYEVVFVSGRNNVVADSLSRTPLEHGGNTTENKDDDELELFHHRLLVGVLDLRRSKRLAAKRHVREQLAISRLDQEDAGANPNGDQPPPRPTDPSPSESDTTPPLPLPDAPPPSLPSPQPPSPASETVPAAGVIDEDTDPEEDLSSHPYFQAIGNAQDNFMGDEVDNMDPLILPDSSLDELDATQIEEQVPEPTLTIDDLRNGRPPTEANGNLVGELLAHAERRLKFDHIPALFRKKVVLKPMKDRPDLIRAQQNDPVFSCILSYLENKVVDPGWSNKVKNMIAGTSQQFFVHDGILYRWEEIRGAHTNCYKFLVCLPDSRVVQTIDMFHSTVWGLHPSAESMIARLRERFWWDTMGRDVKAFVAGCPECNVTKMGERRRIPLKAIKCISPWYMIGMDVFTPFSRVTSVNGFKHILVIQDYFTKWVIAVPIPDQTAKTILGVLIKEVITKFGLPVNILTDNGPCFTAEAFQDALKEAGIEHLLAMPYHQQTNGLVERWNRTLLSMLRPVCVHQPERWDEFVPFAAFAYNTLPHSSTGYSPSLLMFGREMRSPLDGLTSNQMTEYQGGYRTFVQDLIETMRTIATNAKIRIDEASRQYTKQYNKRAKNREFQTGDLVLHYTGTLDQKVLPHKFHPYFDHLYRIVAEGEHNVVVEKVYPDTAVTTAKHLPKDRLKMFRGTVNDYVNFWEGSRMIGNAHDWLV